MPCHQSLAEALHTYFSAAGIDDKKAFLFRTSRGQAPAVPVAVSARGMSTPGDLIV